MCSSRVPEYSRRQQRLTTAISCWQRQRRIRLSLLSAIGEALCSDGTYCRTQLPRTHISARLRDRSCLCEERVSRARFSRFGTCPSKEFDTKKPVDPVADDGL